MNRRRATMQQNNCIIKSVPTLDRQLKLIIVEQKWGTEHLKQLQHTKIAHLPQVLTHTQWITWIPTQQHTNSNNHHDRTTEQPNCKIITNIVRFTHSHTHTHRRHLRNCDRKQCQPRIPLHSHRKQFFSWIFLTDWYHFSVWQLNFSL